MSLLDFAAQEAQRQGVDPSLVLRVIQQESGGRPNVLSPKGAAGPMQLMPGTARDMGVNAADPLDNIRGGVRYLKQQIDTFKDPRLALAAYNAGPGAVKRAGGVPNYPETQGYVRKIMGDQPQSGADIFGMDGPAHTAAQGGSGADIFADAPAPTPAPAKPPLAPPVAPQATPPHVSQPLGVYKGVVGPIDRAASGLEGLARNVGLPVDAINRFGADLGLAPSAGDANAEHAAFLARQAATGVRPGKTGEFGGNMLVTGGIPGGPLVNGALTGAALSQKHDLSGVAGDMLAGAVGGKIGASVVGGAGKFVKGLTGDALTLANKGVPLTVGQMAGGFTKGVEDKLTSVPVLGDVIRNAQRRGIEGANRAAFNDTLGKVGETLPDGVDIGHDAYAYTKQRLGDLYDETLAPLTVSKDQPWSQALTAAKAQIAKIGDPAVKANALNILKTSVQSRFDKAGTIVGQDLKDVQSDLGSHINDLMGAGSTTWNRKAGQALAGVKTALEDLVSRTDSVAGDRLAQINAGWAHLKPLETATQKAGVKSAGVWNMNQLSQGVTKGKAASTVASGNAPHQELAGAASRLLPSSVPDSGTAGRLMAPMAIASLLGGNLPVVGPAAVPIAGLIGGTAALYTRTAQKALTSLMASRSPAVRAVGEQLRLLANPAGTAGAVALSGARQ